MVRLGSGRHPRSGSDDRVPGQFGQRGGGGQGEQVVVTGDDRGAGVRAA